MDNNQNSPIQDGAQPAPTPMSLPPVSEQPAPTFTQPPVAPSEPPSNNKKKFIIILLSIIMAVGVFVVVFFTTSGFGSWGNSDNANRDDSSSADDSKTSDYKFTNDDCNHCGDTIRETPSKTGGYRYAVEKDITSILIDDKIKISLDPNVCSISSPGLLSSLDGRHVIRLSSYSPVEDRNIDDGCNKYIGDKELVTSTTSYIYLYNDINAFKEKEEVSDDYKLENDKDGNAIYFLLSSYGTYYYWRIITVSNGSVVAISTSIHADSNIKNNTDDDEFSKMVKEAIVDIADKLYYEVMTIKD
jgi:hypothetical protein